MIVQCCVCGKVRKGAIWVLVQAPLSRHAEVSHGYCPGCAHAAFEEMKRIHQLRRKQAQARSPA
ncbi:MAG TPA: hypothetical protein PKI11_13315 [Candidatus Hydrogenedentes bacterium]|nr:hypothetical protein [Candidatus Hydrogenedentota bacterium]HNT88486.1 hypothetical protein [Candidatus Hydrogenedentota bacterium]